MLAFAYRFLTDLGAPFISLYLLKRRLDGREDKARFAERLGYAARPRPAGRLVWCHAASVGEAASLLALIDALVTTYPDLHVVITTGTITSARMLATRLPERAFHQYVPVDRMPYVRRFLRHWRPDLALWVESELWPNTLAALHDDLIPTVLLNGRMSAKSFHNWRRAAGWARKILSTFTLCLLQTEEARSRYAALGAHPVRMMGNLKYAAKPLPHDPVALSDLQKAAAGRVVWGMVSTHRGEEEIAITTHKHLRARGLRVLTVIVPRHPVRGDEVARRITELGLTCARRSCGEPITPATDIYLADTMGELGLFYRLCPVVAVGGSFVPVGGHNPVEPAQLGAAIVFGGSMFNFSVIAREFVTQRAALQIKQAGALPATIERLLTDSGERQALATAAQKLAAQKQHVLVEVMDELHPYLQADSRA